MLYFNNLKPLKIWLKREGRPKFFLCFCRTEKGGGASFFYPPSPRFRYHGFARGMFHYMKMKFIGLFLTMIMMSLTVEAALNLTVTPYEGGNSLRFGSVDNTSIINKEVRIRITSTGGVQYRLRQGLINSIVNERGEVLKNNVLDYYTVRGSNAAGSLYQDTPRALLPSDDIVYTSNKNGDSDSFIIVYSLNGRNLCQSGHFLGRIIYTLEPLGGEAPKTFIMNVDFDASNNFNIKIESVSGSNKLKIDTESVSASKTYLKVSVNSEPYGKINIYQELDSPITNGKGIILKKGVLKFFTSGVSSGEDYYKNLSNVEQRRILIYSSSGTSDSFYINFAVDRNLLSGVPAGTYKGKLIYAIQEGGNNKVIPVDLEIDVRKIFDIKVTSKEGLSFFNLKPNSPPQEKMVTVKVESNMNVPYQVIQRLSSPLVDEKGDTIPEKFFTMRVELSRNQKGKTKFSDFLPVKVKDDVVFTSDADGDSSVFNIIYRLETSFDILAGNYATQVTYSLSEK